MTEPKHFPWLDWLRFLAALMVLFVHARGGAIVAFGSLPFEQQNPIVAILFGLTRLGNEAVLVFFVLSGYLVAGKAVERMLSSEFRVADYAIDRFSRIYFPYIPALALTWVCALAIGTVASVDSFLVNVFCLQGIFGSSFAHNAPLWSIAFEVWFYILAGSLGGAVQFKNRHVLGTATAVCGIFLSLAIFTVLSSTYLFCWLLGGMAYFFHLSDRRILGAAIIVAIYSVAGIQLRFASVSIDTTQWLGLFPSLAVLQLLFSIGVAAAITQLVKLKPGTIWSQKINTIGTSLAAFSYTLYLTHYPILNVTQTWLFEKRAEVSLASVGSMLASCGIAIAAAFTMYLLFERNTPVVKKWLRGLVRRKRSVSLNHLDTEVAPAADR